MKKITYLASALFISITAFAQNSYTFSASQGTYTDLTTPISINNNQFWDYDEFGPLTLPFNVYVFGKEFTHFAFIDNYFMLVDSNFTSFWDQDGDEIDYTLLSPISANIQDRSLNDSRSASPISYKTDGTTGNRILKLEVKNAGLEEELWENETLESYLNYQIWIYEGSNNIEFRFGNSSVSNLSYLTGDEESNSIISAFATQIIPLTKTGFLNGNSTSPTYAELETTDPDFEGPEISLSSLPQNGQIYKFTAGTLSTKKDTKIDFSMYPNPVDNSLNITLSELSNYKYAITDILGKNILSGEFSNVNDFSIDTSNLMSGTYFIKINNTTKKFIKK